jgi:penicillin amidase
VEGEVAVAGLSAPVRVIRDRWGVPHISAQSTDDLFLAQGFVAASERLFQLDLILRAANGRLATMFADPMLPMDRFARTVGWSRAGARIADGYDGLSRRMTAAYRAGVRAWLETMPAPPVEYAVLGLEPDVPTDDDAESYWAAAVSYVAWGLSGNFDDELLRAEIAERLGWDAMRDLFPDLPVEAPIVVAGKRDARRSAFDLLRAAPRQPPGRGSNNWVVAGSRTVSGKPLLANDPHLVTQMPSVWFECHLAAPGYEAAGVAFPFAPGVVIGHSPHHAWGLTNVCGDTQDLYLERLSNDGTAAWYEGAWQPLIIHREEIRVRGRDEPEVLEVRETRHGPILESYLVGVLQPTVVEGGVKETYALRWVGSDHGIVPSTLVRMATAVDFEGFREALRGWHAAGQNVVYADVDGTIGYQCTGRYPIRRAGDGTMPVPGWTSEHEWDGFVPFEELPWSVDPPEGFLATANNRIHDEAYPHLIGRDFAPPFRARRIVQLITETRRHSRETFAAMQVDTVSLSAQGILPLLLEVEPLGDRQKEALANLEGWDGDLAADSTPACVYQVWSKWIAEEILRPRLGEELFIHYYARRDAPNAFGAEILSNLLATPTAAWFGADGRAARDDVLRRALDLALEELATKLGEDMSGWRWGALHRVVLAHPLAMIGDLAELFTGGIVEKGGDDTTIDQGAYEPGSGYEVAILASWRQIVDLADLDASLGVHSTGQSGHPASPHWNDLVPLWAEGAYHPLPFTRAAVEAHTAGAMTLSPR